jgi:type III pantothenate kinase
MSPGDPVLVADVGNSRIKLGVASCSGAGSSLPVIDQRHELASRSFRAEAVEHWLRTVAPGPAVMLVASVHDAAAARLEAVVAAVSATRHRPVRQRRVRHEDVPLAVALPEPHRVGIDRLAASAAAAVLKPADRPAIVVDCGTAATVDVVSAAGEFLGGAILPGPALMTRALAEGTSRLPEVAGLEQGRVPAMPGRSTEEAIAAGIGWGMRGAVARLVAEASRSLGGAAEPQVFLTGGWRVAVREVLPGAREMPDLVLHGVALAATRAIAR